jgi:prepilin-type N-terminal cleavage/methylation domain-containing protein
VRALQRRPAVGSLGRRGDRRGDGGFTLPELLAVVAIFSVVAALGAHAMAGSTRAQATQGLARSIQYLLQRARAEAVSDGFQRRLSCVAAGCTLQVASSAGMGVPGAWTDAGPAVQSGPSCSIYAVGPMVSLGGAPPAGAGATATVVLYPDGTATGATLYLADLDGGNRIKLFVFPATAMTRVGSGW